jgi:hypothetical protein
MRFSRVVLAFIVAGPGLGTLSPARAASECSVGALITMNAMVQ